MSAISRENPYPNEEYDYIVESMYCEYKLDVDKIKKIITQYRLSEDRDEQISLLQEFRNLYPDCKTSNILSINIDKLPNTIIKKCYFVQSPKNEAGLPALAYSLKGTLLLDFRALRKNVKNAMEEASHNGNKIEYIRLNAKQLAIKVVCNSEYGASNKNLFAHYDPDIAAAITYAARQLIGFLTNNLEVETLYIDHKFLKDNQSKFNWLINCGCISINPYEGTTENLFAHRRQCLGRIFDINYNRVENNVLECHIKPSTVIYQDTDSNYYINKYIIDIFTRIKDFDELNLEKPLLNNASNYLDILQANEEIFKLLQQNSSETKETKLKLYSSPNIIDKLMKSMLYHNDLIANFIANSANRKPIGLGFEGSFIICRYFNRKKRYYGKKWSEDGSFIPSTVLPNPLAYENNILIKDYDQYWIPKKTVLPLSAGDYIKLDDSKLLFSNINYLDYIKSFDIKCTGIDLTRRDQYKFINYYHIYVLQKDLRIMKYNCDNKWTSLATNASMESVIDNIVEAFKNIITQFSKIAEFISGEFPKVRFNIMSFAKTSKYRKDKQNAITTIVKRLKAQGKEKYICEFDERMSYVVVLDEKTKQERLAGKVSTDHIADKSLIVDELFDEIRNKFSEQFVMKHVAEKGYDYSYDDWVTAKAISMLDFRYYLECLCKSLSSYIIGDLYPSETKMIDDGILDSTKANALISKLQNEIAKKYVGKYFNYGKDAKKQINRLDKIINNKAKNLSKLIVSHKAGGEFILQQFPDIVSLDDITLERKQNIYRILNDKKINLEEALTECSLIYKNIVTDSFAWHKYNRMSVYNKYKNDAEGLLKLIYDSKHLLQKINAAMKFLDEMKFTNI